MNRKVLLALMLFSANAVSQSPAVMDGNLQVIGSYIGPGQIARTFLPNPPPFSVAEPALLVVSPTGYLFGLLQNRGRVTSEVIAPAGRVPDDLGYSVRYFTTNDCSGPGYVEVQPATTVQRGGFVFANALGVFYSPKSATSSEQVLRSEIYGSSGSGCSVFNEPRNLSVIEVLPNDPEITGVPSADFVTPITISAAEIPRRVFKDGFESQA